ncbi:RNA polymerase sigma factor [Paludisphaera mucosa]|uniref:Sigma-70 family RNA polymerase sigma factor n=1 Tax=Paludisphaera mucosa TaxID=3030827 RepID=A0ABT6FCL1_9BACT|nr:sigma-70 family RNA polymerase sigma factor [Paludisphaera mucosa]MDG3005328.1 sigma-70 family RNA polymerase sigma factor [Paludisphaera mucosa]
MNETSHSLLDRLRSRPDDQMSWNRFAGLYAPLIRKWLVGQGAPDPDAEDLAQEILLVIFRELPGFDHNGRKGAFRSWVRSVTVNRLRGYWRAKRSGPLNGLEERLALLEDEGSEPSAAWDREHDEYIAAQVMRLVEPEFAPSTWQSFRRVVVEDRPAAAVAAELGLTVNAVLIAKSRVLRRLREEVRGLVS